LYLKVNIIYKSIKQLLFTALLLSGCGNLEKAGSEAESRQVQASSPEGLFNIHEQLVLDNSVQSIQLYKKGNRNSAPIFSLNSNDVLILSFDYIQLEARQFRISFTHHDPDWKRSSLATEFFQDGFYQVTFGPGQISESRRPVYRSYSFEFPNNQVQFKTSGNYMLHVEDFDTGNLVFSLPFFIHENAGEIRSQVETIIAPRRDLRITHLPSGRYILPEFVKEPEFDLQFYFFQNQFWGRAKKALELDFASENESFFELRRESAFVGDYEFIPLNLDDISQDAPRILSVDPAANPPLVELNEDTQGFALAANFMGNRFGFPEINPSARYADVMFKFDPADNYPPETRMYLVGDFNNWAIESAQMLDYDSTLQRWTTNALVKEGSYLYKYILLEDNQVDDLALDNELQNRIQQYHAFVYFFDQSQFYYRLLQVNEFRAR